MKKLIDKDLLQYFWSKIKGLWVKKTGDTMTGTLKVNKGNGYWASLGDNALTIYHKDGATKAVEIKRDKVVINSNTGDQILKVEDDGEDSALYLGVGANTNSLILGNNTITSSDNFNYLLVVGRDNHVNAPNAFVFGNENDVLYTLDLDAALLVVGEELNTKGSQHSIIGGSSCDSTLTNIDNSILVGNYLEAQHISNSAVFGSEHEASSNTEQTGLLIAGYHNKVLDDVKDELVYKGFDYGIYNIYDERLAHNSCILGSNNTVHARKVLAHGSENLGWGNNSHVEGNNNVTYGQCAHAEGNSTYACGKNSHTEGNRTYAFGNASHTEGLETVAGGTNVLFTSEYEIEHLQLEDSKTLKYSGYIYSDFSFTPDCIICENGEAYNILSWSYSNTKCTFCLNFRTARDKCQLNLSLKYSICNYDDAIEGATFGNYSHAEGRYTKALGKGSHAEGYYTAALGEGSHVEGTTLNKALGGWLVYVSSKNDDLTLIPEKSGAWSLYEKTGPRYYYKSKGDGIHSKALGWFVTYADSPDLTGLTVILADGECSFLIDIEEPVELYKNTSNLYKGYTCQFKALQVQGLLQDYFPYTDTDTGQSINKIEVTTIGTVNGSYCHSEGASNSINESATCSHTEGTNNTESGSYAHISGASNQNTGDYAQVIGISNTNNGEGAIVIGQNNTNKGANSIVVGFNASNTTADVIVLNIGSTSVILDEAKLKKLNTLLA